MDWATIAASVGASGVLSAVVSWRVATRESKDRDKALAEQQRQFDAQHALDREKWQTELRHQRQDRLKSLYRDTYTTIEEVQEIMTLIDVVGEVRQEHKVSINSLLQRLENQQMEWRMQGHPEVDKALYSLYASLLPYYLADALKDEDKLAVGDTTKPLKVVDRAWQTRKILDAVYRGEETTGTATPTAQA